MWPISSSSLTWLVRDERVIMLGISAATFTIVHTVINYLRILRDEKVIVPRTPRTQYITQETEDALHLDTLDKLLQHPNDTVREVATRILCDRAVNAFRAGADLLWGITREDYDERKKNLRALEYLVRNNGATLNRLHHPKAYAAIVRSLELSFAESDIPKLDNTDWDEYPFRDTAERLCLFLIAELIGRYRDGPEHLLRAQFVEKWLALQPWGDTDPERRRNFRAYILSKHNRLAEIMTRLIQSQDGYDRLRRAGLVGTTRRSVSGTEGEEGTEDGDYTAGPSLIVWMNGGPESRAEVRYLGEGTSALRTRDHSAEEQRLRRQHREAMVLNDGTRPVGREDIIEREHD